MTAAQTPRGKLGRLFQRAAVHSERCEQTRRSPHPAGNLLQVCRGRLHVTCCTIDCHTLKNKTNKQEHQHSTPELGLWYKTERTLLSDVLALQS